MELFLHNKISEEQTWWNLYSVTMEQHERIRVITKLANSEQSYKGKVKTHNYTNRQKTGKL